MKTRTKTASFLYVLFVATYIIGHIADIPSLLANFLIACVGIFALFYCLYKYGSNKYNSYLIVFGILFSSLMLISILYNGNSDMQDILWIWAYMGIAALIYEFDIPKRTFEICSWFFVILILAHIIRGGTPREFLRMGSENNISAYLIFFILAGYLGRLSDHKSLKYLLPLFCLVISLWTGSRGGALAAAVLVICVFLHNFLAIKKGKFFTLVKICLLLAVSYWLLNAVLGDFISAFIDKIDQYGGESIRTEIWAEYISGIFDSIGNVLLGVNILGHKYLLLNSYSGNTHNSFLMLHAKFGLIACVLLLLLMAKVLIKSTREKKALLLVVLITSGTRMLFDWVAFTGLYDVLFWYMFIYTIDNRGENTTEQAGKGRKLERESSC